MTLAQLRRAAVEKIDSIYKPHEAVTSVLIFKYIHLITFLLRLSEVRVSQC
jgi:hypothetical protein